MMSRKTSTLNRLKSLRNIPASGQVPSKGAKIRRVVLQILRIGALSTQEGSTGSPRFIVCMRIDFHRDLEIIEIEGNGPGMVETVGKRVFRPFFTTKPAGAGTGLGVSVCH
jgi:C4-dicarboxylate-specific signal transduction histidine kinase